MRGALLKDGTTVYLNPGETLDLDVNEDVDLYDGLEAVGERKTGGLSDLKVDELKTIAVSEGIDLGDATRKDDIIAAIELAREDGDKE